MLACRTPAAVTERFANLVEALVDENIVGLDVGVEDASRTELLQRDEHLQREVRDGVDAEAAADAHLARQLSQIHREVLKDLRAMANVLEVQS